MNLANVQNQVEIARNFLYNAQQEVKQGRGKMLLVVNAQNALVNAQKSLQNTKTNFALQIYSLLSQTGELTVENLIKAASDEDIERKKMIEDYKKKIKNQKK